VRGLELARAGAKVTPGLDELALLGEVHDAGIAGLAVNHAMAVADEDGVVGRDHDIGRRVEQIWLSLSPATPSLPSVIKSFPSELNFLTV